MRFKSLRFVLVAAMVLATTATMASENNKRVRAGGVVRNARQEAYKASNTPKVSTEFGLGVGARYNLFNVVPLCNDFTPKMSMQWSGGAALQFRLNIGRSFGIQPEIAYARSVIRINDEQNGFSTKAKNNIVQIPMLLSFRVAMFRFNFGPVFTLMDNTSYSLADKNETIKQMTLGKLYPAVTYAAGISVKVSRRMMIDVRYADMFRSLPMKSENAYLWTLDTAKQPEAQRFTTTCRSVQLRIGVVF